MSAAARTGELKFVFVELFHHEDSALQGLRDLDPGMVWIPLMVAPTAKLWSMAWWISPGA